MGFDCQSNDVFLLTVSWLWNNFFFLLFCGFLLFFLDELWPIVSPPTYFLLFFLCVWFLFFFCIMDDDLLLNSVQYQQKVEWLWAGRFQSSTLSHPSGRSARFLLVPASAAQFLQFPFFSTHIFAVSASRSPTSPEETRQNILHGKRCLW